MENQESKNLSTTNDYDDLIYYDDDDDGDGGGGGCGDREKNKITKPCKLSLINHKNIAYNILKYLEDNMVKNKEIQELGQCTECTNNILSSPIKAFTILTCGHIFHRPCIEKQLLHTKPSTYPFPNCEKNVNIIVDPNSIRRGSQLSQSRETLALTNLIGKKVVLNSPVIPEEGRPSDLMNVDPDGNVALMNVLLLGGEQRLFKTTGIAKKLLTKQPTLTILKIWMTQNFLVDKSNALYHAVHYDYIDDPCKKCPTCLAEDLELFLIELTSSITQKKCTQKSTAKKFFSKKKKTSNKDDVSTRLKKLIKELLTNTPDTEALYLRYKELKPSYTKDGAKALVKEEVRKQIPETKFSDEVLRKRRKDLRKPISFLIVLANRK
ncbi:hypothetical protein C1646_772230 [Rhizophagus diaphanus]|nr:hypothetical protein C1646_772230 [Rhizophagus diaphanus] [Rhizophagus sp. MUCL 43196]